MTWNAGGAPPRTRQASVLSKIRERPGLHFRALGREARVPSAGQLRHHVDRLVRSGQVSEVADGRYHRFFLRQACEPSLRARSARLARPLPRAIATALLEGAQPRTRLQRRLGCAGSTLGYHLRRLLQSGDVVREATSGRRKYRLAEPEVARRALAAGAPVPSQAA